jgi:hypothetical protein
MDTRKISQIGQFAIKVCGIAAGLLIALLDTLREAFAVADSVDDTDRPIQDSDLVGDYNFRTQQFDSGTDPAGWYEDEI